MNIDVLKNELKKYTKEDIIESLAYRWDAGLIIPEIIQRCETRVFDRLVKAREKAQTDYDKKLSCYLKWRNEMCHKYGDGQTVKLADIPQKEISYGAKLEREIKKIDEICEKCNKQMMRHLQ